MKNFNTIIKQSALRTAAVLALAIAVIPACKNPIENISVAVTTESLSQSPTLVKFVKANPDGPELPASINVTISGPGKEFVQSDDGGKTFTAVEGLLPITLNRFANPTPDNPVVFSISANVEGYVPVSKMISISSPETALQLELELMSYAAPVKGTAVVQTEKPLTAGVVGTEIQIATTASANTPQTATLTLPAGTQVLDANKQPINAGNLKASIVFYGTTQNESMAAAMKSLLAINPIINGEVTKGEVQFVNNGMLSIQMTAGSTPVKHFSQPITAKVELNPDMLHPVTGLPLKAGDPLHIWSMNEETGQWTYEYQGTVINEGGKLKAEMSINHLTVYTPLMAPFPPGICNTTVRLKLNAESSDYQGYQLRAVIELTTLSGVLIVGDPQVFNLASNPGAVFRVLHPIPSSTRPLETKLMVLSRPEDFTSKVAEVSLTDCGDKVLDIPAPPSIDRINTLIFIKAYCSNKKLVINTDDTWVEIKDVTDNVSTNEVIRNGLLNLKLKNGHEYIVTAMYDGKKYSSQPIKIDRNTVIKINNGRGLVVNSRYDGKNVVLTAEFRMNCK